MLQELSITNFAIIEKLNLSLDQGLTVLTGETGAGKSIIIDAIQLLCGGRGSSEFVRHGEKKAELEGLFLLEDEHHPCYDQAKKVGIDIEDAQIVLRREISANGKSVCRVNGKLVTIAIMREIGTSLVDIHGQHEHQELMNAASHIRLLDQFGDDEIAQAKDNYLQIYKQYDETLKKIKQLSENEQQMAHRLDLIQFQLNEIQNANISLNEDDQLLEEKKRLMNFEKLFESVQIGYDALRSEGKGLDWVGLVMNQLETAAELDSEEYGSLLESVSNCFYLLEDVAHQLNHALEGLEFDPERLNFIESRLNEINQLKRKYGSSIEEIMEYAATIEEEIETLTNRESHIENLNRTLKSLRQDLFLEAKQLSELRKKWATKLTEAIHHELQQLYMDKTVFEVRFVVSATDLDEKRDPFQKDGVDILEFYISTNPGEPLKPLSKVASGGELSRMMLALKTIFSKHQGITSIIFDEVDTGVSGRVAQAIGEKIYQISIHSQVLCISHLPQVAALADSHLFISKTINEGRTTSSVDYLQAGDQIKEIARMISGVEMTDLTKQHAKELLQLASTMKQI
ncbi:DNA repair protein RecN (Recombination protein N) [Oikeobacillus pervagus]|uniref:DNA repair protein RecN n=1 Tax=Oikeobacillus pervagus TaxID=1325931 RepID=A0AAJ1SYY0_9BACI|nr:DNA repair protein RecN [Oikeobacillus pervagus]MDQ0213817.1 DNA repair protein RecN (Recombination protein N) [Oikeobacillus pervagus]